MKKYYGVFKGYQFEVAMITSLQTEMEPIFVLSDSLRISNFQGAPEDLVIKQVRGADDNGEDCSIEHGVAVNHNADLIFKPEDKDLINGLIEANKGFIDIYDYEEFDEDNEIKNKFQLSYTCVCLSYDEFVKMDKEELKQKTL